MNVTKARQILEALLFVSDNPLKPEKISQVLELDLKTINILMDELNREYVAQGRCFRIREISSGYQMFSLPEFSEWIRKLSATNRDSRLSVAVIETLAIIAYKQPITRIEIEDIRGVSVSHVLKNLLEKKLVTIAGRKKVPGRPMLYRTTITFLSYFGLKDLSEMPQPSEFKDLLGQVERPVTSSNE